VCQKEKEQVEGGGLREGLALQSKCFATATRRNDGNFVVKPSRTIEEIGKKEALPIKVLNSRIYLLERAAAMAFSPLKPAISR
jgi:uncharacterized protein YqhQ